MPEASWPQNWKRKMWPTNVLRHRWALTGPMSCGQVAMMYYEELGEILSSFRWATRSGEFQAGQRESPWKKDQGDLDDLGKFERYGRKTHIGEQATFDL